jgi:hypothetical protein
MTLNAQIHFRAEMGERFLIRSMRPMTARAIQADVPVPRIDDLLPDRVAGVLLPLVTGTAKRYRAGVIEEKYIVGGVGRMASRAISLLDRGVLCHGFRLPLDGILMAASAEGFHRGGQQALLFGGVRVVAIRTGSLVDQRPMNAILAQDLVHGGVVASSTEFESRPLRLEGVRGGWIQMALVAPLVRNGGVHAIPQHPRPARSMRIVAGGATAFGDRVIHMLPGKRWSRGNMTLGA